MLAGVSTACLYPEYTEKALETLLSFRVQAVEVFINCMEELSVPFLSGLRKRADDGGAKILSVHPYTSGMEPMLFFSRYRRRFHEGMEFYKKYYEACNILGAEIVVFHGDYHTSPTSYDEYFDRFGMLTDDAATFGVQLCHENVSRCIGHDPAFFKKLAACVPNAAFVLDVKQAIRSGEDVFDFARAMNGRIRHVHMSDHNSARDCLVPGRGTFNIREFLSVISSNNFDGGVIVELYQDNFDEIVEISEGYQHLCDEISTYLRFVQNTSLNRC